MRPTDVLREAGASMDATLLHMRQRLWQTPEEAWAEAEEVFRKEEASTPHPGAYDWRETMRTNFHRWLSKRRRK